jgi:hypothetical protein
MFGERGIPFADAECLAGRVPRATSRQRLGGQAEVRENLLPLRRVGESARGGAFSRRTDARRARVELAREEAKPVLRGEDRSGAACSCDNPDWRRKRSRDLRHSSRFSRISVGVPMEIPRPPPRSSSSRPSGPRRRFPSPRSTRAASQNHQNAPRPTSSTPSTRPNAPRPTLPRQFPAFPADSTPPSCFHLLSPRVSTPRRSRRAGSLGGHHRRQVSLLV